VERWTGPLPPVTVGSPPPLLRAGPVPEDRG